MEDYLTKKEIKDEYNISFTTISRWVKSGLLVGLRDILFLRSDVEKVINRPKRVNVKKEK